MNDLLQDYFQKNEDFLQRNYPGLGIRRLEDEYLYFTRKNTKEYITRLDQKFIEQVNQGVPLEYINNNSFFYRSNFFVDSRVLIPRSETEILVEESINYLNGLKKDMLTIAEVGVGSGAIVLSILQELKTPSVFYAGDISKDALEVAENNYFRLKHKIDSSHELKFVQSDRFENIDGGLDFIVSNPPYIKIKQDKSGVHNQVDMFEPQIALYLNDEEYESWFDTFFKDSHSKLNANGALFMEGHEDHLDELKLIAEKYFSKVEILNDYTQRKRFIKAFI